MTTLHLFAVADLQIEEGGFSHWRTKRTRKFLSCHAHFRSLLSLLYWSGA